MSAKHCYFEETKMDCSKEEKNRLRCEHLNNEAWGTIKKHKEFLEQALAKNKPKTEEDLIINAAAYAALMHLDLSEAEDRYVGLENEDDDPIKAKTI